MIEAYLRSNNMFVDYNKVKPFFVHIHFPFVLLFHVDTLRFEINVMIFMIQPHQERVYSSFLKLDLADVEPCISGPNRYNLIAH